MALQVLYLEGVTKYIALSKHTTAGCAHYCALVWLTGKGSLAALVEFKILEGRNLRVNVYKRD